MANQETPITWGMRVVVNQPWAHAIEQTRAALRDEGFGVLTEIDMRQTMKEKLDIDYEPYVILGACNPGLAHQALEAERDIGLLLPCNVVVRAIDDTHTSIAVLDPQAALGVAGIDAITTLALDARARLERVVEALGKGSGAATA